MFVQFYRRIRFWATHMNHTHSVGHRALVCVIGAIYALSFYHPKPEWATSEVTVCWSPPYTNDDVAIRATNGFLGERRDLEKHLHTLRVRVGLR